MLIRGINRQIIVIQDTGSELFESAIFIVSEKGALSGDINMAAAAGEILARCAGAGGIMAKKRVKKKTLLPLFTAAAAAVLLVLAMVLLFR